MIISTSLLPCHENRLVWRHGCSRPRISAHCVARLCHSRRIDVGPMINWVLMVMICPSMQGGCIWERGYNGPIASEERCIAMGLQTDPANIRFKCVLIDSTLVD